MRPHCSGCGAPELWWESPNGLGFGPFHRRSESGPQLTAENVQFINSLVMKEYLAEFHGQTAS